MKLGPLIVVQVTHKENICFYIVMWTQTAWLCMTLTQEQSAELLLSARQIAQEFNRQILDWNTSMTKTAPDWWNLEFCVAMVTKSSNIIKW